MYGHSESCSRSRSARLSCAAPSTGASGTGDGDDADDSAAWARSGRPSAHVSAASISPASAADVSRAAAGMALAGRALGPVALAVDVARAARARVRENFALAALYNLVAVPLAASGHVTPLIAALAMSGSSILVTLNALRLRRAGQAPAGAGETRGGMPAGAPTGAEEMAR